MASADMRGGYTSLLGSSASGLGLGNLLAVPALKLSDADMILPVFYANFAGQGKAIEEDTFFLQRATAVFRPSFRHRFDQSFDGQLRLGALRSANLESLSQKWLTNVYDYEEYSAGVGLGWQALNAALPVSFGLDLFHRGYPNFHELGASLTENKNYYAKDYQGAKWNLEAKLGLRKELEFRALYQGIWKKYTDGYLVQNDGTFDLTTLRQDNFNQVSLGVSSFLLESLQADLGLEYQVNQSNQGFFDLFQNKFLTGYYDYAAFSFSPSLRYLFSGKPEGHSLKLGYQMVLRNYPGRFIKSSDGAYSLGKQADTENALSLDGRFALNNQWAVVAGAAGRFVRSNQQFEAFVKSSYDIIGLNLGVEFKL
jgi:hypothetical protein